MAVYYAAMVGDQAKAAYSRSYVNEYRHAWDKSWPFLCKMLEIIEREETYVKPWMKDGFLSRPIQPSRHIAKRKWNRSSVRLQIFGNNTDV